MGCYIGRWKLSPRLRSILNVHDLIPLDDVVGPRVGGRVYPCTRRSRPPIPRYSPTVRIDITKDLAFLVVTPTLQAAPGAVRRPADKTPPSPHLTSHRNPPEMASSTPPRDKSTSNHCVGVCNDCLPLGQQCKGFRKRKASRRRREPF